ncbi:adenine phosphoribosyltransferase [Mariniphaga sediminis]|uniref:Adenine phosphoribosyltransferase n=1 Tax=Mariniphaga sediminis TaxID=1628158 RepID=A0A399CYZ8_9BACT|nr:adenine phosphoribosyltransferase [Mariniphaga sediminis]RIH63712.1 adenine phosphoribosyltransferase [Mariniphaga sediminis]
MNLKDKIREVPDFPKKGINFIDITTLLKDKEAIQYITGKIADEFRDKQISKVLGIEARGFILGGILAHELRAGFVPVRKKGKLPSDVISETYQLEYGTDTVEIHSDALSEEDVVLIHDDLLATGGTAQAVLNMIKQVGIKKVYFSFLCDLEFIQTPEKEILKQFDPHVLVKY